MSSLYPEALLLDEGLYSLLLTLAQCPSFQQSALVTKLSEALSLDVAYVHWRLGLSILSVSASLNLTGSNFTWRSLCSLTLGVIYSLSQRQSKSNRKQFHFRLSLSLVLRFCISSAHGLSYFLSELLAAAGGWVIHPRALVLVYPEVNPHPVALLLGILC